MAGRQLPHLGPKWARHTRTCGLEQGDLINHLRRNPNGLRPLETARLVLLGTELQILTLTNSSLLAYLPCGSHTTQ